MYEHIEKGDYPSWSWYVQIIPEAEGEKFKWDIYDATKVWPHSEVPMIPVGKLRLNKNPVNYFSEVEQAAFTPSNMVPGIEPTNDKLL